LVFNEDVVTDDHELVAAEACNCVIGSHSALEPFRNDSQNLVAPRVAQSVVQRLEAVEIEKEHGDARSAASGTGKCTLDSIS
jgi:hypothetical protein